MKDDYLRPKADQESYADKYQAALEDQQKNSKNWSTVEKIKKLREIDYLAIQKDYDKDTVGLYGMSKERVANFLETDPEGNGQAWLDKIMAYGDALENAGLGTNKFRDKNGKLSLGSSSSSKKSTKKSAKKKSSGGSRRTNFSLYSGSGTSPLSYEKSLRKLVENAHLS
jgi:hypothetical protein